MKVITVAGCRPEWIRLCIIIDKLDKFCDQILVDTGQNYDPNLRDIFLEQLGIRKPNYNLNATGSVGEQLAKIMPPLEAIILKEKPDAFLVLGDTNSSLGAIMAKRMGVRVFHMEAGNRCFDDRVPEEVNRRIIDHSSDILLPYTEHSRQNLLDEGIHSSRIYVTGNPILEVLETFRNQIEDTPLLEDNYFLATLHRAENVDNPDRLRGFVEAFNELVVKYEMPILWSVHPRTQKQLELLDLPMRKEIKLLSPMGFFEFVKHEKNAFCVLTDSGTVQEECAIFHTPVVTLRDSTERPETIDTGSNFISGCDPERILRGVEITTQSGCPETPIEYLTENVSDSVIKIVLGYWH